MSQEQGVNANTVKDIDTDLAKSSLTWTKKGVLAGILIGLISISIMTLIGIGIIAPPDKEKNAKESTQTIDSTKQVVPEPISKTEPKDFNPPIISTNKEEIKPVFILKEKESHVVDNKNTNTSEDFSEYINYGLQKSNIAIFILDNNNRPLSTFSSEIANLYRGKGYLVTTSLFTNAFFSSSYLNEIITANSKVFDKLGLASQVDYIVIAKYSNVFEAGELTTWISRASLDVSVISCALKSQTDGFPILVSSGHFDKQNAEKGAKEKILLAYKTSHLNL